MFTHSPYRVSPRPNAAPRRWRAEEPTVLVVCWVFWVVSFLRVAWGLIRHEVFAAEATLALFAVVGLPWLLVQRRRGESGSPRAELDAHEERGE